MGMILKEIKQFKEAYLWLAADMTLLRSTVSTSPTMCSMAGLSAVKLKMPEKPSLLLAEDWRLQQVLLPYLEVVGVADNTGKYL